MGRIGWPWKGPGRGLDWTWLSLRQHLHFWHLLNLAGPPVCGNVGLSPHHLLCPVFTPSLLKLQWQHRRLDEAHEDTKVSIHGVAPHPAVLHWTIQIKTHYGKFGKVFSSFRFNFQKRNEEKPLRAVYILTRGITSFYELANENASTELAYSNFLAQFTRALANRCVIMRTSACCCVLLLNNAWQIEIMRAFARH